MSMRSPSTIDDAVDLFVEGAKRLGVGSYLNDNKVCLQGLAIIDQAVRTFDARSPNGRDPLLNRLDDPDEFVRTVAAAALWQSHTERARGVIEHVDQRGITEATMLAWKILRFQGRYNPVCSDPRYEGLHDDENGVDRWHDPVFRERAFWGQLPNTFARKMNAGSSTDETTT